MHFLRYRAALACTCALTMAAPLTAQEAVDSATLKRLYADEFANGQVMTIASWLTDVNGPRLTGSPGAKAAGDWAVTTMKSWGLANVGFEMWSPKFPGWRNDRTTLRVTGMVPWAVAAVPRAWSPGTAGEVTGQVVPVTITAWADTVRYAGALRGRFVMLGAAPAIAPHLRADARRLSDEDLARLAADSVPNPRSGGRAVPRGPVAATHCAGARIPAARWKWRSGAWPCEDSTRARALPE